MNIYIFDKKLNMDFHFVYTSDMYNIQILSPTKGFFYFGLMLGIKTLTL